MARKQTPESSVLEAIGEYLSYRGYVFWRMNNVPIFDAGKMVFRAMPRYSQKGVSDFIVLNNGRAIFIEAKSPKGRLSPEQVKFKEKVEKAGCVYLLARDIKDLILAGL
jgi:hypothetical protein